MALSEVDNMTDMNDVVIVTIPDSVDEDLTSVVDEDKAVLVTAELNTETGEEELTGEQVEAEPDTSRSESLSKEEAVVVKLTEEVDVEADVFYPITCGDAKATLVWKKFVCPGINVKCVQFNEQLISPKEFVCLAGKSTLKDWKRAIRLNGTMLRKIMDSGELDFYQHLKVCSNTCRSTKIDLVGTKVSLSSDQAVELVPAVPSSTDLHAGRKFIEGNQIRMCVSYSKRSSSFIFRHTRGNIRVGHGNRRGLSDVLAGVKEAGLLDEVVEDFQKELQEVLKGLQERVCDPPLQVKDAVLLNNIVQNFGMLDLVKKVLASHKSQMDRYREQYTRSLASLEQQCDEHRKRAKELKSKSQHLNNVLMTLAPVPAPPTPKRPRLTRAVSGPATVNATPTQITLPLNQLTGLPLGKVLTVAGAQAGANLGGYTLLTSPLTGAELAGDASNLTVLSTAAGQEGTVAGSAAAFVKLVGSQFQLVTLPAGLQGLTTTQATTIGGFSVVDTTATTADGVLEETPAELEEVGQPEPNKEEEEEQQEEQQQEQQQQEEQQEQQQHEEEQQEEQH